MQGKPKHVKFNSDCFFVDRTYKAGDTVVVDVRQAEQLARGGHEISDHSPEDEFGPSSTIDTPFKEGHVEGKEMAVLPPVSEKAVKRADRSTPRPAVDPDPSPVLNTDTGSAKSGDMTSASVTTPKKA